MPTASQTDPAKVRLITDVADTLYANTNTFEGGTLAVDLAYLYAAIAKGICVQWTQVHQGSTLALFKHLFSVDHRVWKNIEVEEAEARLIEMKSGQPVCGHCGGEIQCSGTVTVSFVNVDADVFEDSGEVSLIHDWTDAGSAEFIPTEYHCVACGAVLVDPSNSTPCDQAGETEK